MATPAVRRRKRRSRRPVKRSDRVASALILASLAGIFLAVYLVGSSGETRSLSGTGTAWRGGMDVLPSAIDPLVLAGTRTYGPENLYEYVDGQAPYYLQYGFRAVLVGEYARDAGAVPEVVVDVYDMDERRNAFGLFKESFPPEEEPAALGNDGFLGRNVAAFWKASYYVRVTALTEEDRSPAVRAVAESVAERIRDGETGLSEFAAFPTDGLLPGTLGFTKTAAFGLEYLNDVFVASYEGKEAPCRLFYGSLESEQKAREILEAHASYLESSGRILDVRRGVQEDVVWGEHPYVGAILMIRSGALLAGTVRIADREEAERAARTLLSRAGGAA